MPKTKNETRKYANILTTLTLLFTMILPALSPVTANAENDATNYESVLDKELKAGEFALPIMHMNDTHARVENYPKMLTAIKNYRTANENSLLLHAGDVFSGTLYFNEFHGQADLALLNLMDFDAMVFGNHEYDLGKSAEGHKSLSEFVKKANFPLLGSNTNFTEDPHMKQFEPKGSVVENPKPGDAYNSIVVERDGEQIGILGLTTEDTKDIASPVKITFSNYIDTAKKEVEKLEDAGINKIIAVTHIGFDSTPDVGNDLLLAKHVEGIDVIVGGHSHTKLDKPHLVSEGKEAPTVIVQAGQYAEHLGTVEVVFDEDGEVVDHSGRLLPVATRDQSEESDPEALEVLKPFKTKVDEVNNKKIGAVAKKDLLNPRANNPGDPSVRANETELGNLVTDAMLAKAQEKEPDTVIAFQNGGGIRAAIPAGEITIGEVINVLPFGNDPVVAELTGKEIKEILEHAVRESPNESGGFLHISGMKYYYDSTKEVGNRVIKMLLVDEEGNTTVIDPNGNLTYKITTNGFTGQGGDGFDTFKNAYAAGRVKDIGEIDWQQLVDYMIEDTYLNGVVDPEIEGRIIDLKGDPLPTDKEGWIKEGNAWYYYVDGVAQTGWNRVGGTWYYMDDNAVMQTGWVKVGKTWYYMNPSGAMQTGWVKVGKTWYYLADNGAMQTGWIKVKDTWYYMNTNGSMQTGWHKLGGKWYYLASNGAMQTGWTKVGKTWYYLSDSGIMQTGWITVNDTKYYLNNSGAMQTGWHKLGGSWYYFAGSGAMQTGWTKVGKTWYYMHDNGRMQTGWHTIDGSRYYMDGTGAMRTGWTEIDGRWYYFHTNGRMQTGWQKIKGTWYYLDGNGAWKK